jgi:HK97 family phage portal protein
MGLLNRAARFLGFETRASIKSDAYLSEFFNMRGAGGGAVSPDEVLSAMAVATACVSRRSQGLASVPLNVHRNVGQSNAERAESHPLYDVLNYSPNAYQSAFEFREFLVRSHDMFGNGYARIERNSRGQVAALHPLAPWAVTIDRLPTGRLRYRATDPAGKVWILLEEEILHVRGPSRDGVIGLSPIQIARGAMSLALAQNESARSLVANGLRPSGVMSPAGGRTLNKEQVENLRTQIRSNYSGPANAGNLIVSTGQMEYRPFAWSPEDSEFLATRKLSNEDAARIFDCPPTAVGIVDRSTYSNTEQEALALVRNCLAPLAARFESAFARCLLSDTGRRQFFLRHDFSELLRGDVKSRFDAWRVGREIGVYSANDIRRLENEAPISGGDGDAYHRPANWIALDAAPQAPGGQGA